MTHDWRMSAIRYPVAASAEEALSSPRRAAREREAVQAADGPVRFVSEDVGPPFATREAALDAYPGRFDDERPGKPQPAAEDRFCALVERAAKTAPEPVEPSFADGRRWPTPAKPPATVFRVSVSYWRIGPAEATPPPDQARALRRRVESVGLSAAELRALANQPLRPVRPQQPLDAGWFERPAPEAPHILIPDD
jgi:hypothetical protein